MSERHKFVEEMKAAMGELQVKASLAKLELGEVKNELIDDYDKREGLARYHAEKIDGEFYDYRNREIEPILHAIRVDR